MKRRHLLGLTQAELNTLRGAVRYYFESVENTDTMHQAEIALGERLLTKIDDAPAVTEKQVDKLVHAANNLLADPTDVRDHRLGAAFAARDALRKVMA